MNKTNEYNYISNQVNIQIYIRIQVICFASYPTSSEFVFVSKLKCDKKMLSESDYIPIRSDCMITSTPRVQTVEREGEASGLGGGLQTLRPALQCYYSSGRWWCGWCLDRKSVV